MKNLFKVFGIIALVAIIGFSFIACSDGGDGGGGSTDPLNGTWKAGDGVSITLTNGSFVTTENNKNGMRGTYTTSARNVSANIAMAVKELHGDLLNEMDDAITFESKWYNKNQVIDVFKKWVKTLDASLTDAQITAILAETADFDAMFPTMTGTIDGDSMTVAGTTYTKTGGTTPGTTPGGTGSGGTFTLTGIPAQYNGKYLYVMITSTNDEGLVGCPVDPINGFSSWTEGVLISSGKASMPMWVSNPNGTGWVRYTGNGSFECYLIIRQNKSSGNDVHLVDSVLTTFSNGSATRSYNDFSWKIE